MSDHKSTIVVQQDEGRKTAASTYLIDQTIQDFGKGGLEMQVHQGTLGRRSNHMQTSMNMDSPPQRTTASGTLSGTLYFLNKGYTNTIKYIVYILQWYNFKYAPSYFYTKLHEIFNLFAYFLHFWDRQEMRYKRKEMSNKTRNYWNLINHNNIAHK